MKPGKVGSLLTSLALLIGGVGFTYAPLPGLQQTVVVVSGTELEEPLEALESRFEEAFPDIDLDLIFQGSQDMINNYIDDRNDFNPTVLIPANGVILEDLEQRWGAIHSDPAFSDPPRSIASTRLVAVAWPQRGEILFPSGEFDWDQIEAAMESGSWSRIGGESRWGSFDFVMTDPTRSNSGQLTMALWSQSQLGNLSPQRLGSPEIQDLFDRVKGSVYLPPRSTDVLLREFITRGPNDADVATVYESIALFRWSQSSATQSDPYRIYYLNPTMETTSTAAIVQREVSPGEAEAARQFIDFLLDPEQQAVFVQHGFRAANPAVDLNTVPNSPWSQGIPGAEVDPRGQMIPLPSQEVTAEIKRLWDRAD